MKCVGGNKQKRAAVVHVDVTRRCTPGFKPKGPCMVAAHTDGVPYLRCGFSFEAVKIHTLQFNKQKHNCPFVIGPDLIEAQNPEI